MPGGFLGSGPCHLFRYAVGGPIRLFPPSRQGTLRQEFNLCSYHLDLPVFVSVSGLYGFHPDDFGFTFDYSLDYGLVPFYWKLTNGSSTDLIQIRQRGCLAELDASS